MLKIQGITYTYPNGVTIHFEDREIVTNEEMLILGNSGTGKTTLLHIMAGLLPPTRGSIELDGVCMYSKTSAILDQFRGQNIGIIFQKPHLMDALSVFENLRLPGYFSGKKIPNTSITKLATHLGIDLLLKRKPYQLSTGQAQRVAIARALVHQPKLLLADEPTASLDDDHAEIVIEMLKSYIREDHPTTLIVATHDHRVKKHFHKRLNL